MAEIYPDLSVIARASEITLKAGKFFGLRKAFWTQNVFTFTKAW